MVKFGEKTLPLVVDVEERDQKIYVQRPIPGKKFSHRKVHGNLGEEYVIRGLITADHVAEKTALKGLADGVARFFDLEDGSPQICALMIDPRFGPLRSGNLPYELSIVQTSKAEQRTISESFGGFSQILTGLPIKLASIQETFGGFSQVLGHKKGSEYGNKTIGSQNYPTVEEGITTTGAATTIGSDNTWFLKITVNAPCTVKQLHIYLAVVVGNKRVCIYDNASPNNLLGQSDVFVGSAGAWNEINLQSRAYLLVAGTYWIGVTEIDANGEQYHYSSGVAGDAYGTTTSYVSGGFPSTLNIAGLSQKNLKCPHAHTYAIRIKGYMKRAKSFTLTAPGEVSAIRFYSHVAQGHGRFALYDTASPQNLKWEGPSATLVAGTNEVQISAGNPASLILSAGTYELWWQYDDVADAPSYAVGASGEGAYKAQAYGPFPATLSGITGTTEIWTESAKIWVDI